MHSDGMSAQVVIAGGGPTGLMLAGELALWGVEVVVVERRADGALEGSRAGGLHARTIEVLDQRGIAERFLAAGQKAQIAGVVRIPLDISDFPTRHNYGLALGQQVIERLLGEWVAERGVPVVRGAEVVGVAQDAGGVEVALADGRVLRAAYLVGCDGGRSVVRKQAGIAFVGWAASTSYLIAEASMREAPAFGFRRGLRGINAMGPKAGGRVGVVLVEPEVRGGAAPTLDDLRAGLVAVYGTDFGVYDATWISRFSDMARQAERYRVGRVLLAGDAAHVHSPVGGQGLNTGVQDAVNLGWKLALVVRGMAGEALLESYHAERHPVAARVLRNTLAHTALDRGDPGSEALRASLAELLAVDGARQMYAAMMSGLDIRYGGGEGHALVGRRVPDVALETGAGGTRVYELLHAARPVLLDLGAGVELGAWGDRVRRVEARAAGEWALPVIGAVAAPGAVLIRPDGYVAWVGESDDAGLREALGRWFGGA